MSSYRRIAIVLHLVLLFIVVPKALAQNDVIVTQNGDRITGEIKKLEKGVIYIDPDYSDSIFQIDWKKVKQVESEQSFIIETSSGNRVFGLIQADPTNSGKVLVETAFGAVAVELSEIVFAQPFNRNFWNRFNAAVDFGGSVTKSSASKQANLGATMSYLHESYRLQGSYDWNRNVVGESETNRWEANIAYQRFVGRKWFGVGTTHFLQSDELQLQLRTTIAPGIGRFLKRTNRFYWNVAGGGQWTNENFKDPSLASKNSGEGWVQTELSLFDLENLNLLTRLKMSPSLTDRGRIRLDFRSDLKYDLPKGLYIRFGLSDNFDSRPQGDAPRNDYVFSFGAGWEL